MPKGYFLRLQDNITKFEQHNGKITVGEQSPIPPMSFGGGEA